MIAPQLRRAAAAGAAPPLTGAWPRAIQGSSSSSSSSSSMIKLRVELLQQQQCSAAAAAAPHVGAARQRRRRGGVAAVAAGAADNDFGAPCSSSSSSSTWRQQKPQLLPQQRQRRQRRHPAPPRAAGDQPAAAAAGGLAAALAALAGKLDAVYRFTRPHTMAGTAVSVVSVSAMALGGCGALGGGVGSVPPAALAALWQALASALLMNVAIVGVNQLYDVEIDKVNKPYLPLASGDLSTAAGAAIVALTAAAGLALGAASGSPPLLGTLALSLALGVAYSMELPFLRWKRSPWLAALCILAVRAVLVQLGFYAHMLRAVGGGGAGAAAAAAAAAGAGGGGGGAAGAWALLGVELTRPLGFTMGFMLLFSVVIALFKDLPDVKGDTAAGVATFSVRHGTTAIYRTCVGVLLAAYAAGVAFGLTSPEPWSRAPVAAAHAALAALLWRRSRRVDPTRKQQLAEHYMFVWKLFYAEYLILPLLR